MIPGAPAYLPVAGGDQQGDAVEESQEAGSYTGPLVGLGEGDAALPTCETSG